eukprot:TRINITY_DN3627_c0_g1_i1.p1 TRINITY_DN3627_c0_g1~~TRINITY_DN3627_c0_g1_i1.p1  ORF type:complete len:614 (+),score=100.29 TRINITY_DN3627_c0_g1_i1:108-1949(+)
MNAIVELPQNLTTVYATENSFDKFMSAAKEIGIADDLDGAIRTILAPTDVAFAQLPKAVSAYLFNYEYLQARKDLKTFLQLHYSTAKILYASDIETGTSLHAASGGLLNFVVDDVDSTISVNGQANITVTNILGSNGVGYALNQVLTPGDFEFTLNKAMVGLNLTQTQASFDHIQWSDKLNGSKAYTIFAASNAAWKKYGLFPDPSELRKLVPLIVVEGIRRTEDMTDGMLLDSLYEPDTIIGRMPLRITNDGTFFYVNDILITSADNMAGDGVIHIIDEVLPVPPIMDTLVNATNPIFDRTSEYFAASGLQSKLALPKITVFFPINDAWAQLPHGAMDFLALPRGKSTLDHILLNHIIVDQMIYTTFVTTTPAEYTTLDGIKIEVVKENEDIIVDKVAKVVMATNNVYSNGVVQFIDKLLAPSDLHFTMDMLMEGIGDSSTLDALMISDLIGYVTNATGNNYTIFAPSNAAWDNYKYTNKIMQNVDKLAILLKAHIVPQHIDALESGTSYPTLVEGVEIEAVTEHSIKIKNTNGDESTVFDWGPSKASNGYVYGVSTVLDYDVGLGGGDSGLSGGIIALIVILVLCCVVVSITAGVVGFFYSKKRKPYATIN